MNEGVFSPDSGIEALHMRNPEGDYLLDEQTASDIDTARLFSQLNTNRTTFGDQLLWHRLHSQPEDSVMTQRIIEDNTYLSAHQEIADKLDLLLKKLGKQAKGNITADLWEGLVYQPRFAPLIPFWFFLSPVLTALGIVFWGNAGVFGLLAFLVTNRKISFFASSMGYLTRSLKFFSRVTKLRELARFAPEWEPKLELRRIKNDSVLFKSGIGWPNSFDPLTILIDYLRI